MVKGKLIKLISQYTSVWKDQDKAFREIGEFNPYASPDRIKPSELTREEKDKLIKFDGQPDSQVFWAIHQLVGERFSDKQREESSYEVAAKKLGYIIKEKIPLKDTCSLRTLFFAIPPGITKEPLIFEELKCLYINGYIPHLYWNAGRPRFHTNMWFIVDFVIRQASKEIGSGLFKHLSDWRPKWFSLRNYIDLTIYMYNSWNLGKAILDYSEKKARDTGLTGEEYHVTQRGLQESLWVNEGKTIAKKLIACCPLSRPWLDLISYYRDIFALFSFEAFPGCCLIDLYDKPSWRAGVMFGYEEPMRLAVYNMDFANINTYNAEGLSSNYSLLFAATDWALSMAEGVTNRGVMDIVDKYQRRDKHSGKVPCRICGTLFKPKRKIDVTCGKAECIKQNKYLSKKKGNLGDLPMVE